MNCNEDTVFPFLGGGYSNLDPPCNYPQYEIYRIVRKVKKIFPLLLFKKKKKKKKEEAIAQFLSSRIRTCLIRVFK